MCKDGATPLMMANQNGHDDVMVYLEEAAIEVSDITRHQLLLCVLRPVD